MNSMIFIKPSGSNLTDEARGPDGLIGKKRGPGFKI